MFRTVSSNSDSVISVLEPTNDSGEAFEDSCSDFQDKEHIFPLLLDTDLDRRAVSRGSTVPFVNSYRRSSHWEQELDNGNVAPPGQYGDNGAKVKDSRTDRHYFYSAGKQDLDFSSFEADIHRTSSTRDLSEICADSAVLSMAPVITVSTPMSPPQSAPSFRNLPLDMLGRRSKDRRSPHPSGYSTPSGSCTPTGMMTPTGVSTPVGSFQPSGMFTGLSPPKEMKRSTSLANLIHYSNLESVNMSDLYTQQPAVDTQHLEGFPPMGINMNAASERDFGKRLARSPFRMDRFHVDKYKSHSCPHSRHHSPPRQWHRIETVNENDGSLPDIITAAAGSSGVADLRDINFNDADEIPIINEVDDSLIGGDPEVEAYGPCTEQSPARTRGDFVSFAALFSRCRYERDTSVPNTPYEGDHHVFDPEQLVNRVSYFLCAERVSQMTKTYNDIEAVTHLLEEKERDLELAARIGQTLLSKNKELSNRTESLEEQLTLATDKVNQLRHDLILKDELLKFYNEDLEHESNGDSTPNEKSGSGLVNVDFLQKKVKTLEDENLNLRLESAQLRSETDNYEEKEKRLVEDCIQQLADVNLQVESLAEELHQKLEENSHHKEEITSLLAHIADLQKKIRKLTLENMDIQEKLIASTESQRRLTKELGGMQDKYDELLEMLEEAQDELRVMRGKHKVRSSGQHHHSAYSVPTDSLASELETSLQQELSQSNRRSHSWKVFETARAAKRAAAKAAHREAFSGTRMSLGPPILRESDSQAPSAYASDVESQTSDGYSADMDSLYGSNPELGQPGIPGSNDLESALKRLAMRRANEQNERDFQEEEEERRRRKVQAAMSGGTSPFNLRSPIPQVFQSPSGSVTSTGMPNNNHHYKLSEKLQIVKPMEGSLTLRHWQHLATPHLGGIFEEREGVQIKGEKKLDLVEEIYSLSDFEEDDDTHDIYTRKEQDTGLTYTFTDSTIRNPGGYREKNNVFGSSTSLSVRANTANEQGSSTESQHYHLAQQHTKMGDSTQSTPSMPLGLASLLQGREHTGVGQALMRVSALKMAASSGEPSASSVSHSSSDLNQMILSSRSFGNHPFASSTPKDLPGSRSFDQAMKEYEEKRKASLAEPNSSKKPELFAPGMTGKGFLQQLKSRGYSLYGLWGSGTKDNVESSADAARNAGDSNTPTTKAMAESIFSNGAGVGVLGALTNFRRNGMF